MNLVSSGLPGGMKIASPTNTRKMVSKKKDNMDDKSNSEETQREVNEDHEESIQEEIKNGKR